MAGIQKTNVARLLDKAKIPYELVPYTVDENNISKVDLKELDKLSKNRTTTFDF